MKKKPTKAITKKRIVKKRSVVQKPQDKAEHSPKVEAHDVLVPSAEQRHDIYAVGRRKEASARVRLNLSGSGIISINGMEMAKYFIYHHYQSIVTQPLEILGKTNVYDVSAKVLGGGMRGQAEAVRLGVARALLANAPDARKTLRSAGYLSRDPRVKERKKYGLRRARRAPQWQKR